MRIHARTSLVLATAFFVLTSMVACGSTSFTDEPPKPPEMSGCVESVTPGRVSVMGVTQLRGTKTIVFTNSWVRRRDMKDRVWLECDVTTITPGDAEAKSTTFTNLELGMRVMRFPFGGTEKLLLSTSEDGIDSLFELAPEPMPDKPDELPPNAKALLAAMRALAAKGDIRAVTVSSDTSLIFVAYAPSGTSWRDPRPLVALRSDGTTAWTIEDAGFASSLSLDPHENAILVGYTGRVRYDAATGKKLKSLPNDRNLDRVAINPQGDAAIRYVGVADSLLRGFDKDAKRIWSIRLNDPDYVGDLAISPSGKTVAVAHRGGNVAFHDVGTGEVRGKATGAPAYCQLRWFDDLNEPLLLGASSFGMTWFGISESPEAPAAPPSP